MVSFAATINAAKKYVVSSTLQQVDWNAELLAGDLGDAVRALKREPGEGLLVGGVQLPLALAELGLIDLKLVDRLEFGSGAVAMQYQLKR